MKKVSGNLKRIASNVILRIHDDNLGNTSIMDTSHKLIWWGCV